MPARISLPSPAGGRGAGGEGDLATDSLTPAQFAQLFRLPPEQAVEFMRKRGHVIETSDWRALWQDEHARAFTISRLADADILESIRAKLVKAVDGDLSRRDWTKQVKELLQGSGWWGDVEVLDKATGEILQTRFNPSRLRLILDVNTRTAAAAGQWQRFEMSKRALPYLRYVTKRDEKVRDQHRAWNNLTLPVDHPFWDTHAPPNGWNCRCTLVGVSQKDYDKGVSPRGDALQKTAPEIKERDWYNKRTGETLKVPEGIDPGWAYNPGKAAARNEALGQAVADKLAKLEPKLARALRDDLAAFARQPL